MKYIAPVTVADAMLISDNVPETDYAAWAAPTAYVVGNRVIRTSTHRKYERLISGTTATAPEADPVNWLDIGPTNRWAMFDQRVGTLTSQASSIELTIEPGQIVEGLALLDLDCESVTITATVSGATVYSRSFDPIFDTSSIVDWYSFFTWTPVHRHQVVVTDLPPFTGMRITVTIAAATGDVACGTLALGRTVDVGSMLYGASLGIVDYSNKTSDTFGVVSVAQRGYANRMTCRTALDAGKTDRTAASLKAIRATPVVWVGADTIESTVIYGWVKDWNVDLALPTVHYCSFTIEGLV